jgi:hypothetical protein
VRDLCAAGSDPDGLSSHYVLLDSMGSGVGLVARQMQSTEEISPLESNGRLSRDREKGLSVTSGYCSTVCSMFYCYVYKMLLRLQSYRTISSSWQAVGLRKTGNAESGSQHRRI